METPVATRLRRSTPTHDAYTVRVANRRVAALVTAHPGDARRWIYTTRWLHHPLLRSHRLVVGLGVQWTPLHLHGRGHHPGHTPPPATLQLCAGHRCLVFHLAQVPDEGATRIPAALSRFLADPRVTFVGSGSAHDRRMLWDHYGIRVASGRELRAVAGMGNASVEHMAARFLGYPGIRKPRRVAVSAWHAPRLSVGQVEYACVDAYLAFRLGILLCPGGGHGPQPHQRPPVLRRAPPPAPRAPVLHRAPPRAPRAPAPAPHAPAPAPRTLVLPRTPPPVPRAPVLPRTPPPARRPVLPRAAPPNAVALTAVAVDAAESSTKIAETCPAGFTGSDTDTEYGGEVGGTGNLPVPCSSYASDDDDFSDEFGLVGYGAVTDEDEEEEDVYDYLAETGLLSDGVYVVGPGTPSDGDEEDGYEGYKEYAGVGILTIDEHIEEGYKECTGILTVDNNDAACDDEAFVANGTATATSTADVVEDEGVLQLDGYQAPEHFFAGEAECYGDSTEAFDGGEDDGYGQDDDEDWYDERGDGYVQDDDSFDAFY